MVGNLLSKNYTCVVFYMTSKYSLLSGDRQINIEQLVEHKKEMAPYYPETPRIISKLKSSEASSPYGLSVRMLLEADAREFEIYSLAAWEISGVDESLIEEIINQFNVPGYTEASDIFRQEMGRRIGHLSSSQITQCYQLCLHLSLWPDLIQFGKPLNIEVQLWEDLQPCWRFVRAIRSIAKLTIPDKPLSEYETFTHEICKTLGWKTPLEHAQEVIKINFDKAENSIIGKDICDRHWHFCKFLIEKKLPVIYPLMENESYLRRLVPWLIANQGTIKFHNVPDGVSDEGMLKLCIELLLIEACIYDDNLHVPKQIHRMFNNDLLKSGERSDTEVESEFDLILKDLLGLGVSNIVSIYS